MPFILDIYSEKIIARYKKVKIIPCILSDNNEINLEINSKRKYRNCPTNGD
jgi:hypothetical protein